MGTETKPAPSASQLLSGPEHLFAIPGALKLSMQVTLEHLLENGPPFPKGSTSQEVHNLPWISVQDSAPFQTKPLSRKAGSVCMSLCMYVFLCMSGCLCVSMFVCLYMSVYMCICVFCVCVCFCICVPVCKGVCWLLCWHKCVSMCGRQFDQSPAQGSMGTTLGF